MKKILLLLFFTTNLFSQINYDSIIQPRKDFLLLKNDSTITKNRTQEKKSIKFLCDYKLAQKFRSKVFRYSNEKSKTVHYLKQWNSAIVIYFDKKIQKTVIKDFKLFFEKLNNIKNLKISYTNKFEEANYLIKVSKNAITKYTDKINFKSEEEKINNYLYNASYNIYTDKNMKFYSAIVKINIDEFNNELLLKKLKQLFYVTLGNFGVYSVRNESSLLSSNYKNSAIISEDDLYFMNAFYKIIYQQKVNGTTFKKLIKLAKKDCENEK